MFYFISVLSKHFEVCDNNRGDVANNFDSFIIKSFIRIPQFWTNADTFLLGKK